MGMDEGAWEGMTVMAVRYDGGMKTNVVVKYIIGGCYE